MQTLLLQFGYFSGQLGDGATMYLGEVVNTAGERWEIQFKGAGKTPYSRTADGRKVTTPLPSFRARYAPSNHC